MSKNNLRIKIGLTLLSMPNRWIAVSEIAYLSGATVRQVQSALSNIPDLNIQYERSDYCRSMYLDADAPEQRRIFTHLMTWRYKDPNVLSRVLECIPINTWISCKELSQETGVHQTDLRRMLDGRKSVEIGSNPDSNKIQMYRRCTGEIHV